MLNEIRDGLVTSINSVIESILLYVPRLVGGLIILGIGFLLASIVKTIVLSVLNKTHFEKYISQYGVPELRENYTWSNLIAEISKWFIVIIFLVPAADVWGLPRIGELLNQVLLYLPNVFVAVIIALVGFVLARLAHDIILGSLKGVSKESAKLLATGTQWTIDIFVILAVLKPIGRSI